MLFLRAWCWTRAARVAIPALPTMAYVGDHNGLIAYSITNYTHFTDRSTAHHCEEDAGEEWS